MQIQVNNTPSTTVNYGSDTRNRLITLGNGNKTLHYAENEPAEHKESSLKNLMHATLIQAAKEQNIIRVWQSFSLKRRKMDQAQIGSCGIQRAGYL